MPIITRRFHYHEKGNHNEKWFLLARDTESGDVFIQHEWAERADQGSRRIELVDFLATDQSSARTKLIDLIGSLVEDNPDPK